MNITIYNPSSFGGNYEYSKALFRSYSLNPTVESCTLLMPVNAAVNEKNVNKMLYADICLSKNKLIRKAHFLYRIFWNPFIVFRYLKRQPSTVFIFNDYEQLSAFFWVPLFRLLKRKHYFAVILHDPDRDTYFSAKLLSERTMKCFMSIIDVAFHHGFMPVKKYYTGKFLKVAVPHGIYDAEGLDLDMLQFLKNKAEGCSIVGIIGNIRDEKNYEDAIDSLTKLSNVKLLVAGRPSSSAVSVNKYKDYAVTRKVADKVIWLENYLSQPAFNAVIRFCDIILLIYKPSFTSQSGVLNSIAPFAKKLIISDSESSLKECVIKYDLAKIVSNNDISGLSGAITELLNQPSDYGYANWQNYIKDSSWEKHVDIALSTFREIER